MRVKLRRYDRLFTAFFAGALAGFLVGCETRMDREACSAAEWEQVGYRDGLSGLRPEKFEDRASQCARFKISADRDRYLKGWQQSLEVYCTAENGLRRGAEGRAYQGICPADKESDFLAGYDRGRAYEGARDNLASAEGRYDRLLSERDRLNRQLDRLYDALEDDTLEGAAPDTTDNRDVIRQHIDQLRDQIRDIDSYQLRDARRERDAARRALDVIERAYEQFSRSLRSDQLAPLR